MSKLNLKLISHTMNPELVVATAGKLCYSPTDINNLMDNLTPEMIEKFVGMLTRIGHESPLEHATFTFAVEGISRSCYDDKTEVYTNQGWKLFKDLNKKEKIMTRNKYGKVEFHHPNEYIEYDFKGDMHKYISENIDLLVTPNHNMLIKKYDVRKNDYDFELIPSEDINVKRTYMTKLVDYDFETVENITIPEYSYMKKLNNGTSSLKTLPKLTLDSMEFIKLLAWYTAEGSTYYNEKENSYSISISQTKINDEKNTNRKDIYDTIKKLGFTPTYNMDRGISFKNSQLGLYFKSMGVSYEKYIPKEIFNVMNKKLARLFISVYEKSDGHVDKNGCSKLYTTSKELADQLQILTFIAGYTSSMYIDDRVGQSHYNEKCGGFITHKHKCYVLNISKNKRNSNPVIKKDKHISKEYYDGKVYCVNVENHTLFVRRNGKCIWSGNCSHQIVRHRIASFSQQSQRYVKLNQFEYIIPTEIENTPQAKEIFIKAMEDDQKAYDQLVDILFEKHYDDEHSRLFFLREQQGLELSEKDIKSINSKAEKKAIEDARYVFPNACETKMVFTMNLRTLINFCHHRCCRRAQDEINGLAWAMVDEVTNVSKLFGRVLGANCQFKSCPEGAMTCGLPYPKK